MATPQVPAPLTRESLGIPGERERYRLRKRIIQAKLNGTLLPAMRRHNIDMWIMIGREFNADPLLMDIGGGWPGVRNAYVFFDSGGDTPEKIFIGSHEQREDLFRDVYDIVTYYGYDQAGLAPYLRDVVHARNPRRIGINMSPTLPMADGLTATLKGYLENAIGPEYTARLVSAELVARDFRATRLPVEFGSYRRLCEWTVAWLDEGFSPRVVQPGVTTPADIHWFMRAKARELGLECEFLPGLVIYREGDPLPVNTPDHPILPGDVVTMDAGLAFDLYRSDYQRTAYVLREGEKEPPPSFRNAYADAIRVRDRLIANMTPGEIAYKVFDTTMAWAESAGYEVMYPAAGGRKGAITKPQVGIYSHSIGNATHGIAARIAVNWPTAYGDRVGYPLQANEWYSVELGVHTPIPEWGGRTMFVGVEEDVALLDSGVEFFARPQEELIVIPT
ncbi:MAG: M24 family metallopeptidase [Anaerolineae bacterium]